VLALLFHELKVARPAEGVKFFLKET
jgi:hypothetical protein